MKMIKIKPKLFFILLSLVSCFFLSCDENKVDIKTKSYTIKGLKSSFLLPERFEIFSKVDVEKLIELEGNVSDPYLKYATINKQAHFLDKTNEDYVIVIPFQERIYLEKDFMSPFSYMMNQELNGKSNINFQLIDRVFIRTKNHNQAFKLKYKHFTLLGDRYATVYLITDRQQSFMLIYHSFYEDDFHDIVAIHMNRN